MDIRKTYKRSEVEEKYTWDLSDFFKSQEEFESHLLKVEGLVDGFEKSFKGRVDSPEKINEAIREYMIITEELVRSGYYVSLLTSQDNTNQKNAALAMEAMIRGNSMDLKMNFFEKEILDNENTLIERAMELEEENRCFLEDLLRKKETMLSEDVENAISQLSLPLNSFMRIYETAKIQDMEFPDFEANGSYHELSYNIYEGLMENEADLELRRNSFRAFSDKLEDYKNLTAAAYLAHCQKEKALASLRGFDSVIDYLLFNQKVPRELYDRQIDTIMKDLSPIMRRYAKLLKEVHGLDEIRYEDLKIDVDNDFDRVIEPDEAKDILLEGLGVLGPEYGEILNRAFDERWIDFVNNTGKSTGAFCASPYGIHPYILISWTGKMTETMVLSHELGHAGHFFLAQKNQNILNTNPSTYFVEAPSTTNELIMANHLLNNAKDLKERRYYLSQIISRTYYHNFVTHLLEADYQREVYRLIDSGKSFNADKLSEIFTEVLREFWGEDIVLTEGAELTWMRQPHYYMGLYPYTYSAGLTIGTQVSQAILEEGETAVNRWLDTLKLGGTKDPVGLAKVAGVDITTDGPLKNTIEYIGSIVDEMIEITDKLN